MPEIELKVYKEVTKEITEKTPVCFLIISKNRLISNNRKLFLILKQKWTMNLFLCCLILSLSSLQFGYNISSNNPITNVRKKVVKNFEIYDCEF